MPFRLPSRRRLALSGCLLLLGACSPSPPPLTGTVEWDRVDILAEVSEPVVELDVHEGERVRQGQLLLRLDPARTDARLQAARADLALRLANLAELRHGARPETIDAARAELARLRSQEQNAQSADRRARMLIGSGAISKADLDNARDNLSAARAAVRGQQARLDELLHGTRPEQLDQATAQVDAARATLEQLSLTRDKLDVRAPEDGRVDALPHRLGDQPTVGSVLVTLLAGKQPYARVYVPEPRRARIHPGDTFVVRVDGIDTPFQARVRSVRNDPAFTPYYALTGNDAARLYYRAELTLEGAAARRLPAGVPCQASAAGTVAGAVESAGGR